MSPPLAVAGHQYCRGALAHGLSSERRQPAGLGVDARGGQTAGHGTSSEEETAVRIECKGARNRGPSRSDGSTRNEELGLRRPVSTSNRNCRMTFGPGLSRGGSNTLSWMRAMCGTKAKRFEGSVEIAWAPAGDCQKFRARLSGLTDQSMAAVKRSPKRTANCDLAMDHSRGGMIHSFSERFKTRKRSLVAASSLGKWPLARTARRSLALSASI